MKRFMWLMGFTVFLVAGVLSVPSANAQSLNNFEIISFDASYHLSRNEQQTSLLKVKETIVADFPNFDQNHGILRAIPESYDDHTVTLEVRSVEDERGEELPYETYHQNGNLVLKIGDPDQYVRGQTTYVIQYTMRNVTLDFADHDEFYWDINGDEWPVAFGQVKAILTVEPDIGEKLNGQLVCFAGKRGEPSQGGCEISRSGNIISAVVTGLSPYKTLTVAVGFEPGTFLPGPEIAAEQKREKLIIAGSILAILLPPSAAGVIMYNRWRKFGDDPRGRGVIVPEYQPPKNLDVLEADYLYKQDLRTQAISAQLIAWAVAGYIQLHELPKKGLFGKKDYQLILITLPPKLTLAGDKVLQLIFGDELIIGSSQKISDLKKSNRTSIYNDFQKIASVQAEHLHTLGYFVKNPRKIKTAYRLWSIPVFAIGAGYIFIGIATAASFIFPVFLAMGGGFILAGAVMVAFSFLMPARTQKGVELHDYMVGLKEYIGLAEKDRLNFGQSPEGAEKIKESGIDSKNPKLRLKLFEDLLPYAMLFGLEKKWAKQFEGIYKTSPDWYSGHHGAFTAAYLGSSLGDFQTSSASSFSPPSSSSSGGLSGGGSAGGGGGGGGGGGW